MQTIPKKVQDVKTNDGYESGWVQQEFGCAQLGDERLNQRLSTLVEHFIEQPEASIPKASITPQMVPSNPRKGAALTVVPRIEI